VLPSPSLQQHGASRGLWDNKNQKRERENMPERKEMRATYDKDSKRYHRYVIDEGQGIKGALYIPKEGHIPKEVVIRLRVKE